METLPTFRYHPDPLRSGSVVASPNMCRCCNRARGYVYTGPTYAEADNLDDHICPWCIADGSAAKRFEAVFVDEEVFEDDLPAEVIAEVTERTPSYSGWQQEEWPTCCDDAAAFITPVGYKELHRDFAELEDLVIEFVETELDLEGSDADKFLKKLNLDVGPTAYIFRCLHCQDYLIHVDFE